jgi:hypothetical protein
MIKRQYNPNIYKPVAVKIIKPGRNKSAIAEKEILNRCKTTQITIKNRSTSTPVNSTGSLRIKI